MLVLIDLKMKLPSAYAASKLFPVYCFLKASLMIKERPHGMHTVIHKTILPSYFEIFPIWWTAPNLILNILFKVFLFIEFRAGQ